MLENKEIPPLSPLNKGGASSGGIISSTQSTSSSGIVYIDNDSVRKRNLIWNGSHLPYNTNNVDKARVMRREMTPAENKLWYGFLRTFKYRVLRQRPIDHYIADFYCAKLKLVIELDGKHHLDTIEYDNRRTNILQVYGLQILRFTNEQVLTDFTTVCNMIENYPPLLRGGAPAGD